MVAASMLTAHIGHRFGLGWWFLLIPLLLILLFVVLLLVFGRRWRRGWADGDGSGGRVSPARQAEATLAERYAKGDIDEVEYRARLEVLRANAANSTA